MNSNPDTTLQNESYLIPRRACIQRRANLTARAYLVKVRARGIQRKVDELLIFARKSAAGPRVRSNLQQQFCSFGIPFSELVERRAPGIRRRISHTNRVSLVL